MLSAGQPRNGRHPCQRSAQAKRGPLTQSLTSPYGKVKRSAEQSASSGAGQDAGTSLQAAGHPDYQRCCPQDNPGMGATHVRGRPKPKRPLNAKPRTKASHRRAAKPGGQCRGPHPPAQEKTREHRCQWPRPDYGVAVRRTASEGAPPMSEVGPSQRGPLTQSLASPRSKLGGSKAQSASSGAVQDAGTSPQAAGRPDYQRCCSQDSPGMSAIHVRGRPKPKRPLNAKPRTSLAPPRSKARGPVSRSASSGAGEDAGTSLPVAAPGLRRCCPQDSLGRGASHVRGRPKPKRPLNAKPRIAAQQG